MHSTIEALSFFSFESRSFIFLQGYIPARTRVEGELWRTNQGSLTVEFEYIFIENTADFDNNETKLTFKYRKKNKLEQHVGIKSFLGPGYYLISVDEKVSRKASTEASG
jgi:hypothetical protein